MSTDLKRFSKSNNADKEFNKFVSWLREGGAEFPDVAFQKYKENERGVHAKDNISRGELVIKIPRNLLIHNRLKCKYTDLIEETKLNVPTENLERITLYMLEHMSDKNSYFTPYFEILPKDLSHIPIFWSEEELENLEASHLIKDILQRQEILKKNYDNLCKLPGFKREFSFEDYCYVRIIVASRNFGIIIDGHHCSAMVPLADMLNHHIPPDVKWTFEAPLDSFTMRAQHDIPDGKQIMDSYGHKANNRYLLFYGFSLKDIDDQYCETCIEFDMEPDNDDDFSTKSNLINKHFKALLKKGERGEFNRLLSQLRILNANKEELKLIVNKHRNSFNIPKLSDRNERIALEMLLNILENRYLEYGTTVVENSSQLELAVPYSNEASALNIVMSEKKILEHFINLTRSMI
tara:strand:- start:5732 stop:6952 length:1221 start_codon:yes stop_codon:yes gene_type:complete